MTIRSSTTARTSSDRPGAADDLVHLTYEELRSLAREVLRHSRSTHGPETTSLVHEAYARLSGRPREPFVNSQQFLHTAARAMRFVIVDHLRRRTARKRQAPGERLDLEGLDVAADVEGHPRPDRPAGPVRRSRACR